ncbi:MAG: oligosaccharide flippase family protein [bacterium]|nr:oligosaccharide flippase family protein [bacterium]
MINQTAPDTTDEIAEALDEGQLAYIKKKSVSGAISYFIRTLLLSGVGIISTFALSFYLSPSDFGVFGIVAQVIGLLNFFSDIGLAASLIQKRQEPSVRELRSAFTIQQILSWLIVLICGAVIVSGVLAAKTGPVGNWILLALAISFPLTSLKNISSILLERELAFSKLVIPQMVEQLLFNAVLVYAAWKGLGAMAFTYAILIRTVSGVAVMWYIKRWPIGFALNKGDIKGLLQFGVKFQLNDFIARIKDNLSYLLLGFFLPLQEFGYIQWAKQWSMYPYNLTVQNVISITFPTFSRLQNNPLALKKAIEKTMFFVTLLIFPLLIGMSVFITPLTEIIPRYTKWQPAILTFILFTLSIGWAAISTPLTNTLNALGEINKTLKLMILWTSLTWILTPLFVWRFGFNGVAVAAILISFTSFLPLRYVRKLVDIQVWPQIWPQLLAASGMAIVGYLGQALWSSGFAWFALGTIICGVTYLLLILLFAKEKLLSEVRSIQSRRNLLFKAT